MRTKAYILFFFLGSFFPAVLFCQTISPPSNLDYHKYIKNKIPTATIKELDLFCNLFSRKLVLTNLISEASSFYNKTSISLDQIAATNFSQNNINNTVSLDVLGITFNGQFVYKKTAPGLLDVSQNYWYKVYFDADKYKEKQKDLAQKINPEALSKYGSAINDIKQNIATKLMVNFKDSIESGMQTRLDSLSKSIDITQFEGKSATEIGNILFGENYEKLKSKLQDKLDEVSKANIDSTIKDSTINTLKAKIKEAEKKQLYLESIVKLIKVEKIAGTIDEIKELNKNAVDEYNLMLKNPEQLSKKIAAKFKLTGIEKIFSMLSKFKIGGQELPFSNSINIPNLSKGISFEINFGNKHLEFSTGQILPVVNNLQLPLTNGVNNNQNNHTNKPIYWFMNYRKGSLALNHSGIKITNISNAETNNNQLSSNSIASRNVVLVNLYARERVFSNNWLNLEISKSITQSANSYQLNNATTKTKTNNDLFNLNNSFIKVKLEGTYENAGISYESYFNKSIGAFNNTVESNTSSSGFETGFLFRLKQKDKKLSGLLKGSIKDFNIPGAANAKWTNIDFRGRIAYKIKQGQSIQFSPTYHNGYKTYYINNIFKFINQKNIGITSDINVVNKRIFGLYNTSFISLGYQHSNFPIQDSVSNNSIASNSTSIAINQTFLYGSHILLINLSYVNISQAYNDLLYNSQLDIDAGGVFKISNKISMGASLVYGYLKGAYTNVGIKYSLSGNISKNCTVDLNTDIRKNIKLINPFFSQFINFNCGIKYNLK